MGRRQVYRQWTARDIEYLPDETRFTVFVAGNEYAAFHTPLAGEFNVCNCLGVIAAADVLGLNR